MKLHASGAVSANLFTRYGEGYVVVNADRHERSVIVLPERLIDWAPSTFEALSEEHFATLATLGCEVILLGTGSRLRFPSARLLRPLVEARVGIEVMNVPAACRT